MRIYTVFISLVALLSLVVNAILLYDRTNPDGTVFNVIEVIDGDTFTIEINGDTRRVRLMGVDTPEAGKCLGREAKEKLSELILDKSVSLKDQFTDPYGRIMANVFAVSIYVNKVMLESGLGRMDYYENPRRDELKSAYGQARSEKLGIFSNKCISRTPPFSPGSTILCDVKGNIDDNTQKKVYFRPDCNNYSQVTIDISSDDRWFCSEEEAIEAGFAKSKTCN